MVSIRTAIHDGKKMSPTHFIWAENWTFSKEITLDINYSQLSLSISGSAAAIFRTYFCTFPELVCEECGQGINILS